MRFELIIPVEHHELKPLLQWQPEKGLFKLSDEYWVSLKDRIHLCTWACTDPTFTLGP
jgi:hypothetical protein